MLDWKRYAAQTELRRRKKEAKRIAAGKPISPQARVGMVERYERRRMLLCHNHEARNTYPGLVKWVFGFRRFMGLKAHWHDRKLDD